MVTTPTTPDIFDQVAAGTHDQTQSQTQPVSQQATQGQGDIFDQVAAGTEPPAPASQSPVPTDTVSAVPDATTADKLKNWAMSVSSDLKHGTTTTTLGTLLHKLGAPGLDMGVSPGVSEFMGSLPIGLLRATKGGAELTQPGQRWQGTKDTAGGLLDAATIPGSFVAPEAGELTGQGVDTAATQAARAAKAVKTAASKPFDVHTIQAPLQQGVRSVLDTVAKDAGVTPSPSASIRDVASSVADAVLARSKGLYASLDAATGGNVSRFEQAARNINQKLREVAGLDDENEAALVKRKADIELAQEAAFAQAKAAGVDPATVDKARADWKQAQSLYDLDSQLKMSASGMRPELAGANNSPEVLDPRKAFERLNKLYNSGRLQQAVGQAQSEQIIQHADSAFLHSQKILARQRALKTAGKITGTGAAIGALGEGSKIVSEMLGGREKVTELTGDTSNPSAAPVDAAVAGTRAIENLPAPVRNAVSTIPIRVVNGKPYSGTGDPAIASVGDNDPNTIEVNDPAKFAKDPTQAIGHEIVHLWQNNLPPSVQKNIPADDPDEKKAYDISDVDKLRKQGKTLASIPREKAATIVQRYISTPSERKRLQPWIDDMNETPLSTTMPTAPNAKGLNMTPRSPGVPSSSVAGAYQSLSGTLGKTKKK